MDVPAGDAVLNSAWLSGVLAGSPSWPHGSVEVLSAARIGVVHGLSGHVHRAEVETQHGGKLTLVVKQETAHAVERELLFHRENGELLRGSIPACVGGATDNEAGRGVILLEDVAPAEQGDVLLGCTDERAEVLVRALARVHGASWTESQDAFRSCVPRWDVRPMEADAWADRLARAHVRFPGILTPSVSGRLHDVPERAARAIELLQAGPTSWIHGDAHLDNVLWRLDGTAVLLDWCGAVIGPPAIDLARCLTEGLDAGSHPEEAAALLSVYGQELRSSGVHLDIADLPSSLAHGLVVLLQSAVGWAGRQQDPEPRGRVAALRENLLRSASAWGQWDYP